MPVRKPQKYETFFLDLRGSISWDKLLSPQSQKAGFTDSKEVNGGRACKPDSPIRFKHPFNCVNRARITGTRWTHLLCSLLVVFEVAA